MLRSYYNHVALHQVVFDNHCHTQICCSQRPQHTEVRRKQFSHKHESWMSLRLQTNAAYLVYFWMPISFGIDKGRMMTRQMMERANRWSVYQWYGISASLEPVTVSYKEIHTGEEQTRGEMSITYLLQNEGTRATTWSSRCVCKSNQMPCLKLERHKKHQMDLKGFSQTKWWRKKLKGCYSCPLHVYPDVSWNEN